MKKSLFPLNILMIAAIALAPQHGLRAGQQAGVGIAARAQQAGRPEFDLRRVEQDGLERNRWRLRHGRRIPARPRRYCASTRKVRVVLLLISAALLPAGAVVR